jgi:hypothetical protein
MLFPMLFRVFFGQNPRIIAIFQLQRRIDSEASRVAREFFAVSAPKIARNDAKKAAQGYVFFFIGFFYRFSYEKYIFLRFFKSDH